ncbi:MAG: hypothetical protein KJS98_00185 [Nitrospirae bacterium]|nr:hypothetical protein [Nitrospirota bacterium]
MAKEQLARLQIVGRHLVGMGSTVAVEESDRPVPLRMGQPRATSRGRPFGRTTSERGCESVPWSRILTGLKKECRL